MNWKHIPLALRVALALLVANSIAHIAVQLAEPKDYTIYYRVSLATSSFHFASEVLFVLGFADLVKTLVGRARIGAQIALACAVLGLLHSFAWAAVTSKQSWIENSTLRDVMGYSNWAASALLLVGLGIAALDRIAIAILGFVSAIAFTQPPFLIKRLFEWLSFGRTSGGYVQVAMTVLEIAVITLLLAAIARPPAAPEPELAQLGFRRAAASLWWRVIAVAAVPALMLLMILGKSEDGAKTIAYVMVLAAIVNVGSMTWYAVGAISVARSRIADMRAVPLYVAGVSSLACAGLQLWQTPLLIGAISGRDRFGSSSMMEELQIWSVAAPLVGILSLVALAAGIAGFAGRRCFNDLHSEASGKGMGAGALMLVPLGIAQWLLPTATSAGSAMFMLLVSLSCAVSATVMMARLCGTAADAIDREPSLPEARVV